MPENRHHIWYPRRHYKTKTERLLRNNDSMIIKMDVDGHNELHAVLQPPLKLAHDSLIRAICLIQEMDGEPLNPAERIYCLADYLAERTLREQKVASNLRFQASFVEQFAVDL